MLRDQVVAITGASSGIGAATARRLAGTKNAVRTILEGLRQESTDGTLKTTAISPGYVHTEFADSVTDPSIRAEVARGMESFALDPDAVVGAVEYAVDQPWDVEVGELSIRPTTQG